ncbi:MAG: hypothetical protein M3Z54_01550 [Gemmatimonadota bacterium]|nr:hypothetical protein [Gemmatimonadota bacterium]
MESEPWDGHGKAQKRSWRLVTVTTRADPDIETRFDPDRLRRKIRRVRSAIPRFWRLTDWGRQVRDDGARKKRSRHDTSYILAEEVAIRGMVHAHALVYGEYIHQRILEAAWSRAYGEPAMVDVRSVKGNSGVATALREVLKYVTKAERSGRTQARHAAAVELGFRNVHRVSLGGAIRKIKIAEGDTSAEDVKPEDLHDDHVLSCLVCGAVGRWKWICTRTAEEVDAFGGFGLLASPRALELLLSG